jgi:hypothetical protein
MRKTVLYVESSQPTGLIFDERQRSVKRRTTTKASLSIDNMIADLAERQFGLRT